jgi:3-oxoacyl-[acyl-carrier protein] reductase
MNKLKKIIITGCSKGIGHELCKYFLKRSYKVLGISRSDAVIKNKNFYQLRFDLSKKENIEKFKRKISTFNPEFLINNAANLGVPGKFDKINFNSWENSFALNFFAHARLTHICLRKIINNKGKIFFIAGGGAANSFANFSSYSVAKTAIVRLAENLSEEYKHKIGVYVVTPGVIDTNLYKHFKKYGHKVENSKFCKIQETFKLLNFLISTKKKFLNGRYFHVRDNYEKLSKKNIYQNYFLRRNATTKF